MHTTALITAALALGARIADAAPNEMMKRAEVDVNVWGYGTCHEDSDCRSGWNCENQFEGNDRVKPISVCMPGDSSNDKRSIDRRGGCQESGCRDGWYCDEVFSGNAYVRPVSVCLPGAKKRDVFARDAYCDSDADCDSGYSCDRVFNGIDGAADPVDVCLPAKAKRDLVARAGTCETDSDCSDSEFCDEYLTFMTGTLSKAKACYPKPAKRDVEARAHGNCDDDSDCKKYGSKWTCDTVYSGRWTADIKVCIP